VDYSCKDNPATFGIMYAEDATKTSDTIWFVTEKERSNAVYDIERTGLLDVKHNGSPLGRKVAIYAFTVVNAMPNYYIKRSGGK
jgi:hypothetical protein